MKSSEFNRKISIEKKAASRTISYIPILNGILTDLTSLLNKMWFIWKMPTTEFAFANLCTHFKSILWYSFVFLTMSGFPSQFRIAISIRKRGRSNNVWQYYSCILPTIEYFSISHSSDIRESKKFFFIKASNARFHFRRSRITHTHTNRYKFWHVKGKCSSSESEFHGYEIRNLFLACCALCYSRSEPQNCPSTTFCNWLSQFSMRTVIGKSPFPMYIAGFAMYAWCLYINS